MEKYIYSGICVETFVPKKKKNVVDDIKIQPAVATRKKLQVARSRSPFHTNQQQEPYLPQQTQAVSDNNTREEFVLCCTVLLYCTPKIHILPSNTVQQNSKAPTPR